MKSQSFSHLDTAATIATAVIASATAVSTIGGAILQSAIVFGSVDDGRASEQAATAANTSAIRTTDSYRGSRPGMRYNRAVPTEPPPISRRKGEHVEIAASGRAEATSNTLLDDIHLVHQALPELATADIDLSAELAGKRLTAPLVITGMTGGTVEAAQINRDLAVAAQAAGVALGLGSQRAMAEHPELAASYAIRDVAPDVVLLGNIGAVQALALGPARVLELVRRVGADALCVHLNPGQELVQEHGDRDFRGVAAGVARLIDAARVPVIVKETGCGLSAQAARALAQAGATWVDVSGAGGTSWVAVEALRAAPDSDAAALGQELWQWGVPTAVSIALCASAGLSVIASGGVRNGVDVARALALGARLGGMAAPMLRAQQAGGAEAVRAAIDRVAASLRAVCVLTGCRTPGALARAPRHLSARLRAYIEDLQA
jgi:isopentenyl-diphosphate delta-isomerase